VRIVVGLVAVIVGAALLLYPDKLAPFQLYAVCGWAIVFGLSVAFLGLQETDPASGSWEVIVGLCMTVFGLANWPVSGQEAPSLIHWTGALLVFGGISRILGERQRQSGPQVRVPWARYGWHAERIASGAVNDSRPSQPSWEPKWK
jgi:uncharacterized membrane protein HdeD (DUF308 family)